MSIPICKDCMSYSSEDQTCINPNVSKSQIPANIARETKCTINGIFFSSKHDEDLGISREVLIANLQSLGNYMTASEYSQLSKIFPELKG